ncbi:helix-turn-helix domain-containing protein [Flavobacteriaceae bacterium]|nr:helix-turn-helix domain-containing protein [Flavobacteriaceae bacterium]
MTKQKYTLREQILTSREVEDILSVSKDTLNRYCMNNQIPYHRPTGGKRYFKQSDVRDFLNRNRSETYEEFKARQEG